MDQQLTFFGTVETVVPPRAAEEPAPPPAPPPAPADPRQSYLFDGPHSLRREVELACEALDAEAVRRALSTAQRAFPGWTGAAPWARWADSIDYLTGHAGGHLVPVSADAKEQARRALALSDGPETKRRFPGMSPARLQKLRAAALCLAATRLFAEGGAAARLADGRPAGFLHLAAGLPEEAAVSLSLQRRELPDSGQVLGYLGEALWRAGRKGEAAAAYRDACLVEPGAVDEKELTCRWVMDLLDRAGELDLPGPDDERAWLPVLADLQGGVPLSEAAAPAPEGAGAARRAAATLSRYRRLVAAGGAERERLALKRELLALAPGLKALLQKI